MNTSKLLAVLGCLVLTGAASASDLKEPYKIRIVLDVAKNRLLTGVFTDQLKRDLHDGVQAAMGKLARVEVVETHPLLDTIRKEGLQRALDGYKDATSEKVHFVLIDFSGTHYEIQARQYDGQVQMASPAVRRERTRDRAYVARAAALLLDQDIGLVGTIISEPDAGRKVRVEWKAGGLGRDLGRWLKKGEVLAVPPRARETLPSTLLVIDSEPKDGVSTCTLFSRYQVQRAIGQRCILMGTRSGTLRLRLLQERPGGGVMPLQAQMQLEIRRRGFEGEEPMLLGAGGTRDVDTARKGDQGRFDRVAFVTVLSGDVRKARIPIPIIDDRLIPIVVPAADEATNDVLDRFRSLVRNVATASQVLNDLFGEINALNAQPDKRGEAMTRVRAALLRSREDYKRLSRERSEVATEFDKLPANIQKPNFADIDARLAQMDKAEGELLKHVDVLEKIDKEENDPKRREWLISAEKAKVLEKDADLGEAIAIYKTAPAEFNTAALKKHLGELEAAWKPANADHEKARTFIYSTYGGLSTSELASKLKEATDAFEQCKKANDRWGPLRMLKLNEKHIERIVKEGEKLNPEANIDDEKPARVIAELVPKVRKLDADIRAYLEKK